MYNRYYGNTGRVERVGSPSPHAGGREHAPPHTQRRPPDAPRQTERGHQGAQSADGQTELGRQDGQRPPLPAPSSQRPPGPLSGLSGMVSEIMKKFSPQSLDTDDILLILILWLLYKESGDEEFLITMIAMFLL